MRSCPWVQQPRRTSWKRSDKARNQLISFNTMQTTNTDLWFHESKTIHLKCDADYKKECEDDYRQYNGVDHKQVELVAVNHNVFVVHKNKIITAETPFVTMSDILYNFLQNNQMKCQWCYFADRFIQNTLLIPQTGVSLLFCHKNLPDFLFFPSVWFYLNDYFAQAEHSQNAVSQSDPVCNLRVWNYLLICSR